MMVGFDPLHICEVLPLGHRSILRIDAEAYTDESGFSNLRVIPLGEEIPAFGYQL